uniref:Uncharacterized protein n=1 Tax=Arundo donax TaxID=35708 RepID=A0A0A9EGS8_ARUDO
MIIAVHETMSGDCIPSKMRRAMLIFPHLQYMSISELDMKILSSNPPRIT